MSFFSRAAPAPAPSPPVPPPSSNSASTYQARMVISEMDAATRLASNVSVTCFEKCFSSFNTAESHTGEIACSDRCAIKFMEASTIIGEIFSKHNQAAMTANSQMMNAEAK
jgi:hypothetical protein